MNILSYIYKIFVFLLFQGVIYSQVSVSIPDTTAKEGKNIKIPIYVSDLTGLKVRSYYFEIKYDKSILKAKSIIDDGTLSDTRGWDIDAGFTNNGIYVYADGYRYLSGGGKLVIVKFEVIAEEGQTDLILDPFQFNNGSPNVSITHGSFTVYAEKEIAFSKVGSGDGNVYVNDEKIDLPSKLTLIAGVDYRLRAEQEKNSTFEGWEGGISSSENSVLYTVKSSDEIEVNFSLKKFNVTSSINPQGFGTVNGVGVYNYNDKVTLEALPYSGMEFSHWTLNDQIVSNSIIFEFNVTENMNLSANFVQVLFQITASAYPLEAGQVTGSGYYFVDQTAEIEALTNTGWQFSHWTENDTIIARDSIVTFPVSKSRDLVANYSILTDIGASKLENKIYLSKPYPNPFNPSTTFEFGVKAPSNVVLKIIDINGKEVYNYYDEEVQSGRYLRHFNATSLASGIYIYKFIVIEKKSQKRFVKSGKMLLLK